MDTPWSGTQMVDWVYSQLSIQSNLNYQVTVWVTTAIYQCQICCSCSYVLPWHWRITEYSSSYVSSYSSLLSRMEWDRCFLRRSPSLASAQTNRLRLAHKLFLIILCINTNSIWEFTNIYWVKIIRFKDFAWDSRLLPRILEDSIRLNRDSQIP